MDFREAQSEKLAEHLITALDKEDREDDRRMKWLVLAAAVLHGVLLFVTVPEFSAAPRDWAGDPKKIYLVRQVRFRPPPPPPQQQAPRVEKKRKKIPIPDPTPLDPEPMTFDEIPVPEIDFPETDELIFGIPDAPSPGSALGPGRLAEVFEISGEVQAPQKLYGPRPRYTEDARLARIEGVVILRTVIDTEGNVVDAEVIKGLPLGLSESAVEMALSWKYKPATLHGEPVPVYLHLTVSFRVL